MIRGYFNSIQVCIFLLKNKNVTLSTKMNNVIRVTDVKCVMSVTDVNSGKVGL